MSRFFRKTFFLGLALAATGSLQAATSADQAAKAPPSWTSSRSFAQLGQGGDSLLLGVRPSEQIEFSLRRDRLASDARLHLDYTPSPALIPTISHLRVYLNDELMDVLPIGKEDLGRQVRQSVPLNPQLIADFNRVRLEFVGHYTDVCEDPSHSALWLSLSRNSRITLKEQALTLQNDLAHFPLPFFDAREHARLTLPMVFASAPELGEQRAAAILASYFGSLAGWRGTSFPVLYGQLPQVSREEAPQPAVVFASNQRRPEFLADLEAFPLVDGPVIQLIDHPDSPYTKLLLILGRDDDDLGAAAAALALESDLLRGPKAAINQVKQIQPRQPYDAPNWMRTDRPVRFAELIDYPEQLHASGLRPRSITVDVNLPPDLFVWRNQGIPLRTKYRYTSPAISGDSRLNISINDQFIASLSLKEMGRGNNRLEKLRLDVLSGDTTSSRDKLLLPALKIGDRNRIRYDFSFTGSYASAQRDHCQSSLPPDIRAIIDDDSSIDLSGYHHYIGMPNLSAFARSGFPFSRMADLSETVAVVPAHPSEIQLSTLLEALAGIAARSGYPALGLQLSADWEQAAEMDADLLVLGRLPAALQDHAGLSLLLNQSGDRLLQPGARHRSDAKTNASAENRLDISATGPIAAIIGLQSPSHAQRSIVALLASEAGDYHLLRDTLGDSGKLDAVSGSVSLIRSSGVSGHFVGERYFVGRLPWWLLIWFHLSEQPLLLALIATVSVILIAFLVWRALQWVAHRRLGQQD